MTCKHGFIGACAECDGSGQQPEQDETCLCVEPGATHSSQDGHSVTTSYSAPDPDAEELPCDSCGGRTGPGGFCMRCDLKGS